MNNHKKICASIKSKKNPNIQCSNKRKIDSEFCGKHQLSSTYFIETIIQNNNEETNDIIIKETNNELVQEKNDELVQEKNDELVQEKNDELVQEKNDELVQEKNDELVQQTNDMIIQQTNDMIIQQTNDIIIQDNNNELVQDTNDIIIQDNNNEIYEMSINELFMNIQDNKYIPILIIRRTINNTYLKLFINTKQSKSKLIKNIKYQIDRERYYINREDVIKKIQSIVRMFLKKNRYSCVNEIDILTMDNKMEIQNPYFYKFHNKKNNKYYAYDIRLLYMLITSNYKSCPYTLRKFEDDELNKIISYVKKLQSKNINIEIIKDLSKDEIMENKVKDLFYKLNMLDNYTNHKWFLDLDVSQLIQLYISAEDIWNYRSSLSSIAKYNIIQNNYIFNIPVLMLRKIKYINKLRNILLKTFDKWNRYK